jgi:hypothetical protein
MTPKEYIISKLKELVIVLPKCTSIDYQFDEDYKEHLVRIVPYNSYDSETVWNFRIELDTYFKRYFPDHSIMYLHEDSLVDITFSDFSSILFELENVKQDNVYDAGENWMNFSDPNYALAA